jgi:hypothetical protein
VVDLTYSKSDLRDIVCDNIRSESRSNLVEAGLLKDDPIRAFLGHGSLRNSYTGEHEDAFDYVYRHTFQRPRDLMSIGARLSSLSIEQRRDAEIVKRVVNDAATIIAGEYLAEIEPYLSGADLQALWAVIPGPVMTPAELNGVMERFDTEGAAAGGLAGRQVLTLLYKTGLLGYTVEDVAAGGLTQRFVAPGERTFDADATLPGTSHYLMHPALTEIVSARNRAYVNRIDRTNILGAGRPWLEASHAVSTRWHYVLKADIRAFSRFMVDRDKEALVRETLDKAVERHTEEALFHEVVQGDEVIVVADNAERLVSAAQRIMEDLYRLEGRPALRVAIVYGEVHAEETAEGTVVRGGTGLRMAARVEPLVVPNQIWVDAGVRDALERTGAWYTAVPITPPAELAAAPGSMAFDVRKRDSENTAMALELFRVKKREDS